MTRPIRYPLTVFYDASCPMCASEMHALRERDGNNRFELVDCSAADFSDEGLRGEGITRERLMQRIHARDAWGRWLVGMDALEAVYRAAGLERAAALLGRPRWRPLLEHLYGWVARRRQFLSLLRVDVLARRLIRGAANPPGAGERPR